MPRPCQFETEFPPPEIAQKVIPVLAAVNILLDHEMEGSEMVDWRKRRLENRIIAKSIIEKMKRPRDVARVFGLFLRKGCTTAEEIKF